MITGNSENFIKSKLLEYRSELENIITGGNISQYYYLGYRNDYNEICDSNYENRLRISLALWYASDNLDVEFITVPLLIEEIKYLENSSYGGTSKTLFLLLMKLSEYKKSSYRKLFKRAKYANMDCFFEVDIHYLRKLIKNNDWHKEDWDYIFELLDDKKSQEILKNIQKSEE